MTPRRKKQSRRRPVTRTRRKTRRTTTRIAVLAPDAQKLRKELDRAAGAPRWNADPEDVRRSVVKLVLTLVELLRRLMERQAIRRMEHGTLTDDETEKLGLSLMRLEETIREIGEQFDLKPEDLNLDLGPVGKLM